MALILTAATAAAKTAIKAIVANAGREAAKKTLVSAAKKAAVTRMVGAAESMAMDALGIDSAIAGPAKALINVLTGKASTKSAAFQLARAKVPAYVRNAITVAPSPTGGYDVTVSLTKGVYDYLKNNLSVAALRSSTLSKDVAKVVNTGDELQRHRTTQTLQPKLAAMAETATGPLQPSAKLKRVMEKPTMTAKEIAWAKRLLADRDEFARQLEFRTPGGDKLWDGYATYDPQTGAKVIRPRRRDMAEALWKLGRQMGQSEFATMKSRRTWLELVRMVYIRAYNALPDEPKITTDPTWWNDFTAIHSRKEFYDAWDKAWQKGIDDDMWDVLVENGYVHNVIQDPTATQKNWEADAPKRREALVDSNLLENIQRKFGFQVPESEYDSLYTYLSRIFDSVEWHRLKRRDKNNDSTVFEKIIRAYTVGYREPDVLPVIDRSVTTRDLAEALHRMIMTMLQRGAVVTS